MQKLDIQFRHDTAIFDDVEWIRKLAERDYGYNWSIKTSIKMSICIL